MGRIAFVTDSTAGVPGDHVKEHRVTVVPLQVMFGIESFKDGVDLTQKEFLDRLKTAKNLPTTSQPSVADFEAAYQKLLDDPEVDSIISIHLSSRLPSGTYSSATQAAERLSAGTQKKISVIDSHSAYMGEGIMVINASRASKAGKSHDEVVKMVEDMRSKVRVLLLVDTLEYLHRGGRIDNTQAFIGGLLNIKPILQVKDGRVEPLEKRRTRRKAMERLVEIAAEATKGKRCQIAVGHAGAPEDAEALSKMIREKMTVAEEFNSEVGPVLATHTGPGVLGFVYYCSA